MIEYSFHIQRFDFNAIHQWLSGSYWSANISKKRVEQGFKNSNVVIGAFSENKQIGIARCVTDTTRFAYIADVYVDEVYRGEGIATEMIKRLLEHPSLIDADCCYLFTKDAHDVYRKLGFTEYSTPERFMIRRKK